MQSTFNMTAKETELARREVAVRVLMLADVQVMCGAARESGKFYTLPPDEAKQLISEGLARRA